MNKSFLTAFAATMLAEGVYSKDRFDPGGETCYGISRVYWPKWEGWKLVDKCMADGIELKDCSGLIQAVRTFYEVNFWNRFIGDSVAAISEPVSLELFDTAVNLGVHKAVSYLQQALNLLNGNSALYPDIVVDGILGKKTLSTLTRYLSLRSLPKRKKERLVLNIMNILQGTYYIEQMKKYPAKERNIGWFLRT